MLNKVFLRVWAEGYPLQSHPIYIQFAVQHYVEVFKFSFNFHISNTTGKQNSLLLWIDKISRTLFCITNFQTTIFSVFRNSQSTAKISRNLLKELHSQSFYWLWNLPRDCQMLLNHHLILLFHYKITNAPHNWNLGLNQVKTLTYIVGIYGKARHCL